MPCSKSQICIKEHGFIQGFRLITSDGTYLAVYKAVATAGNTAYVADANGLAIVDISVPEVPIELSYLEIDEEFSNDVVVRDNIV